MTEFGREYGEGLYELCAEEKIEQEALKELQALKDAFRENDRFVRLLGNMTLSKKERVGIVDETLKGQVHEYVLNFVKLLVERGAIHEFSECAASFLSAYNREHGVVEAEVTTAKTLTESQRVRLIQKLQEITGREVNMKEKVDPAVLGGVLLQMDGKRYDNTLRGRLKAIRQIIVEE